MVRAQRRKFHFIYKTTCLITGKWYIGMHSTDNLADGYQGSGTHLSRSVKKHGKENHVCEVLEFLQDRESLARREDELITEELRKEPLCMNIARGGIGNFPGFVSSEESKEKNSIASKKMWDDRKASGWIAPPQKPEHVAKRAAANAGKKRTAEQIENLNRGQQGYYETADKALLLERGQKAALTRIERGTNKGGRPKGLAMSEEQKQRQSVQMAGDNRMSIRASCMHCRKETTAVAIKQFHAKCL